MTSSKSTMRFATGFSLVEVLVSVALLGIGLLGAAAMLLQAARASGEAGNFGVALNLARELSEKTRLNAAVARRPGGGNAYLVNDWRATRAPELPAEPAGGRGCAGSGTACDPDALARWDLRDWQRRAAKALPGVRVRICFDERLATSGEGASAWECGGRDHLLVVKLGWTPRNATEAQRSAASAAPPRLVMPLLPASETEGQGND